MLQRLLVGQCLDEAAVRLVRNVQIVHAKLQVNVQGGNARVQLRCKLRHRSGWVEGHLRIVQLWWRMVRVEVTVCR